MPKLYSSNRIIKVLRAKGFLRIAQKGSHIKFRKHGIIICTVIVPANKNEVPRGTFRSILRQVRLTENDFEK